MVTFPRVLETPVSSDIDGKRTGSLLMHLSWVLCQDLVTCSVLSQLQGTRFLISPSPSEEKYSPTTFPFKGLLKHEIDFPLFDLFSSLNTLNTLNTLPSIIRF